MTKKIKFKIISKEAKFWTEVKEQSLMAIKRNNIEIKNSKKSIKLSEAIVKMAESKINSSA